MTDDERRPRPKGQLVLLRSAGDDDRPPAAMSSDSSTKPLAERTDDELMLLARGGLSTAFEALVRRHQAAVLRIAAKQLGALPPAKDAAQAAFLELYRFLPRYRPLGKLKVLLYRIVIHQCLMAFRSLRSDRRARSELSVLPLSAERPLPEDEILRQERCRVVERGIETLAPKLRSVVVLRFAGDLSYQEIAEVLGLPIGTVRSRLFEGLKKLRKELEGELE